MPAFELLKRFWSHIGLAVVLVLLFFKGQALDECQKNDKTFRGILRDMLKQKSDKVPDVVFGVQKVLDENEARRAALEQISKAAEEATARSEAADAELKRQQAENARKFAAVQKTLDALRSRKPTGDCAQDMEIISRDSELPWKGWNQ